MDYADFFFRYTGKENRPLFSELPGESVDPFTGTLTIAQEDLSLPGRAGLDLRIVRTYSSKIWARADLLDVDPLMAERDASVLGYGWSLHFGRLRAKWNDGTSTICGNYSPMFQEPDGNSHVFYPVSGGVAGVFVSKDHWRLEQGCRGQSDLVCVWSDSGVRYEFAPRTVDWRGDTRFNDFMVGATDFAPVTDIVDPFGNRISIVYINRSGAPDYVVDTYGRTIQFSYSVGEDGRRLTSLEYNNRRISYEYLTVKAEDVFEHQGRLMLPGPRRFLAAVVPPEGPPTLYDYAYDVPVANNQYALSMIINAAGGTTSYSYEAVPYFTGLETVPFSVVTHRTVAGRGVPTAEWSYSYRSPAYGAKSTIDPVTGHPQDMHVTTITRPDGLHDTYVMYGFGWVANKNDSGYTYAVGLTAEIARGDRTEVETYEWGLEGETIERDGSTQTVPRPISAAIYSASVYSSSCGAHWVFDPGIYVPVMRRRWIQRDQATFETEYSNFDAYGQPGLVTETGYVGGIGQAPSPATRTTTTTYFHAEVDGSGATLNMVRGKPETQTVCDGAGCVVSSWSYDEPGHPVHTETKSGVTTTFDHTADGNLSRVTNALGQRLDVQDYWNGVPRTLIFNREIRATRTVTWEGWIESETNGRGYTTTTLHDAIGRPLRVTPPGQNAVTEYTYAPDASYVTVTRQGDHPYAATSFSDGLGRVTATVDTEGVRTSARYDTMGRAWFKSYPYDAPGDEVGDKLEFDALGRVILQTRAYRPDLEQCDSPGACTVASSYLANCLEARVQRGPNDETTRWSCSTSFGDPSEQRLAEVADADGSLWKYEYSTAGQLSNVEAPLVRGQRTYGYDNRQFLVSETTPESGTTTYGRNAIGQVTSRTDARNLTVSYLYDDMAGRHDPLGRLRRIDYPSGSAADVTMDYDEVGNVTLLSSQNGGRFEYTYDELNRPTSQKWTFGGYEYETSFHYDSAGCLDSVTYPTGTVLTMTCDAASRVTSVRSGADLIVSDVHYHPSGQPSRITYGNGVSTDFGFDDRGRTVSVTAPGALGLTYTYDGADNVISSADETVPGSAKTMTYDALDRLRTVTADGLWGLASYEYDELGNRTRKQVGTDVRYTYGDDNRLEASSEAPDHGTLTFTWDDEGNLASSSDGVTYRYDGHGRRVQKSEASLTTVYHYDPAGRVIAEALPDGTKLRDYIYLGGKLVALDGCVSSYAAPCNERHWYHTDTLGSAVARTDMSGAVVARIQYGPWGEEWSHAGESGDRQYNGRVYDSGTGFHDYGARMYWPQIGRFISADPYQGDIASPASLNRYSYVHNNPYKYTDPTGHIPRSPYYEGEGRATGLPPWILASGAPIILQGGPISTGSGALWQYESEAATAAAGRSLGGTAPAPRAAVSPLARANYAQRTYSETFSDEGAFAGQKINDVAARLKGGDLKVRDVEIQYIERDGNTLILNTRSAQALNRAGVPREEWNAVNMTGNKAAEARLTGQLTRNKLTSAGTPNPQSTGR